MGGLIMSRIYLILTLIPGTLFTVILLLIRALPSDASQLHQLLLPEGCPAPCLMGIRPGVTTMNEAIELLEKSGWVENIETSRLYEIDNIIWHWNDQKPNALSKETPGLIEVRNKYVTSIMFTTNFTVGDARLTLGLPDAESIDGTEDPISEYIFYSGFYNRYGFSIDSTYPCHVIEPLNGKISMLISKTIYPPSMFKDSLKDIFSVC